ncbi:PepSY domain-containing protein [Trichothermofontia sp.]
MIFIPLFLTALTGIAYRLGQSWFGLSEDIADRFMVIHQGEFLGQPLVPFYVLLSGLGLLGMIGTGLTLVRWQRLGEARTRVCQWSWVHRLLAVLAFLPLTISALTGIGYGVGRAWFALPGKWAGLLLRLHQGSYWGATGRSLYVLMVGLGLLGLLITGIQMSDLFRHRRSSTSGES